MSASGIGEVPAAEGETPLVEPDELPLAGWVPIPDTSDGFHFSEGWSVPWSDLMMVMFVFFAVLYVYGEHDASVVVPRAEALAPEALFERSQEMVRQTRLDDVQVALQDDRSVRVSVPGPMFFDPGEARVKPGMTGFLNSLAAVIRDSRSQVQVVGHTDDTPIHTERFPTNWDLSAARAAAVTTYLVERANLDPARFTVVAHGMYRPAVPNDSPENSSLNRRVDVVLRRDPSSAAGAYRP